MFSVFCNFTYACLNFANLGPTIIFAWRSLPWSSDASAILSGCSGDQFLFCFSQEHLVKFGDHVQSQQCMLRFMTYLAIYWVAFFKAVTIFIDSYSVILIYRDVCARENYSCILFCSLKCKRISEWCS